MPVQRAPAAASEQSEPVLETIEPLLARQRPHSCCSQLNRERNSVEALTDLDQRAAMPVRGERPINRTRPLAEQFDRSAASVERWHTMNSLTADSQRLAARVEDLQVRAAGEE